MALNSDPGYVQPHHFKEKGETYEIEGPKSYGLEI
jgi:hypothetical protein